jgi:hypothetical protein
MSGKEVFSCKILLGGPFFENVKFRNVSASVVYIPSDYVHTMHRMGCVYFNLLCLFRFHVGLKSVMLSGVSMSRYSHNNLGSGGLPSLLPSAQSRH